MKFQEIYTSGEYLEKNPTWHAEKSPWKAKQMMKMVRRSGMAPKPICEVGCGAGEFLRQVQEEMDTACSFWGYEISPQAIELARSRENERLRFKLADLRQEDGFYDLIRIVDTLKHLEDCFSFLRDLKSRSQYKIIHFVLDLTVESLLRSNALMTLLAPWLLPALRAQALGLPREAVRRGRQVTVVAVLGDLSSYIWFLFL